MTHFNQLTPAEAERLAILAEEAAEIIQIVGKILRHGYASYDPTNPGLTNRDYLQVEIGDLLTIYNRMAVAGDISTKAVIENSHVKEKKLDRYTHHQ